MTTDQEIIADKELRRDTDAIIQRVKGLPPSRERSLTITKLQEGGHVARHGPEAHQRSHSGRNRKPLPGQQRPKQHQNPTDRRRPETVKRTTFQGQVVLRLTVRQAALLGETLMATVRECDATTANRPTIRLCDALYRKIQKQTEVQRPNNGSATPVA